MKAQEQEVFQIASFAHSSAEHVDGAACAPCRWVIDPEDDLTTASFRSIVEASIHFAFVAMP